MLGWRRIALILGAVAATLLLAEVGLRAGGWGYLAVQQHRNLRSAAREGTYRILCLGESTTAMGGNYSYPAQLERILDSGTLDLDFAVINAGVPGTNTDFIASQFKANLELYRPHMVVAMMGANNLVPLLEPRDRGQVEGFLGSLRVVKLVRRPWTDLSARPETRPAGVSEGDALDRELSETLDPSGTARKLRREVDAAPADPEPRVQLGQVLSMLDEADEAERCLREALELDPDHTDGLTALGDVLVNGGRLDEAEDLYVRALAADPAHRNAAMSLGVLHTRRGRDDLAQRVFMGALERDPANPGAASELAQLHARQGDLPAAFAVLTGTLAHVPEEHVLWEMAGRFHCENGRGREGEQMLARAAEIRPDRPSPHQVRATCLEGLGDHLAAAEAMGRVVELEAPTASRYRQVAELYELAGDGESAAANLALAAELEADYVDAKARDAYQYLYEVCRRRGLPLVAVQYPAADVTLVEALFQPGQEVTVVDNGPSFRDAIERDGYDTYFTDRFGGEFGHATTRGNQLLASNVADAILAAHFEDEN